MTTILCISKNDDVEIASFIHQCGRDPEEGTPIHSEDFNVVVTLEDGTRYQHFKTFYGMHWKRDAEHEFGGYFINTVDEAKANAEYLAQQVRHNERISLDYWHRVPSAYGSEAHYREGDEGRDD